MVFDPFQLEQSITPESIRKSLQEEDWAKGTVSFSLAVMQ
jgi:hypothetical protein